MPTNSIVVQAGPAIRPVTEVERREIAWMVDKIQRVLIGPLSGYRSTVVALLQTGKIPFARVLTVRLANGGVTMFGKFLVDGGKSFVIRRRMTAPPPDSGGSWYEKSWDWVADTASDIGSYASDLGGSVYDYVSQLPAAAWDVVKSLCRQLQEHPGEAQLAAAIADTIGAGGTASSSLAVAQMACAYVNQTPAPGTAPGGSQPVPPPRQLVPVTVYPADAVTAYDDQRKQWRVAARPGQRTETVLRGLGQDAGQTITSTWSRVKEILVPAAAVELPPSSTPPTTASGARLVQVPFEELARRLRILPWYRDPRVQIAAGVTAGVAVVGTAAYVTIRKRR